jgi:hypothetical protein
MRDPETRFFQLCRPVSAVKLKEHPGSSLRSPTEILVDLPVDAIVELEGSVARSGLANVLWNGDVFSVFFEDVETNARRVRKAST